MPRQNPETNKCMHQVFFVRLDWETLWQLAFHKQPDFSVQNSYLRQCQTKTKNEEKDFFFHNTFSLMLISDLHNEQEQWYWVFLGVGGKSCTKFCSEKKTYCPLCPFPINCFAFDLPWSKTGYIYI